MLNSEAYTVLAIVVVAFIALRWLEHKWGHRIGESDPGRYEDKIAELQRAMEEQRNRYEQKIKELERRIDFLVGELQRAGIQIKDLEMVVAENNRARLTADNAATALPAKPLLFICSDATICDVDRHALRRTNVSFQRLYSATKATVAAELRRRRQDGTLYPWLHITAHADEQGIHLADGIADPAWWNEHLDGISIVFLAACKTATVADALAGMVSVVFVLEDIENGNAGDFTYSFWRRMKDHGDARLAYRQAITEAPQIAEYTDIRTG